MFWGWEHAIESVKAPIETGAAATCVSVVMVAPTLFGGVRAWLAAFSRETRGAKGLRVCLVFIVGVIILVGVVRAFGRLVGGFKRKGRIVRRLKIDGGTIGDELREECVRVMDGVRGLRHFESEDREGRGEERATGTEEGSKGGVIRQLTGGRRWTRKKRGLTVLVR